jgi:acyl dehydratase
LPRFSISLLIWVNANVNLAGIVHGEQDLIFHNPIPAEGTLTTEGKITHMYDKGKGKRRS